MLLRETLSAEKLGDEGYVLRTMRRDSADCVIAAGATPRGTKAALAHLMRTIQVEARSASVPVGLHSQKANSYDKMEWR